MFLERLQLLHDESDEIARLRSKYRWFIVPVVNPDGYEYSIEHVGRLKTYLTFSIVM